LLPLAPIFSSASSVGLSVCRGLCAEVVIASEVMLAHGLAEHEIDRWMEAYKRKDFEALKVGYRRKRRAV
jgi:hypothetical protein